jgi:hypothetical protein
VQLPKLRRHQLPTSLTPLAQAMHLLQDFYPLMQRREILLRQLNTAMHLRREYCARLVPHWMQDENEFFNYPSQ